MRIDVLVFDGMDLMDFAGPFEVFLTADRMLARQGRASMFPVATCSPDGAPVRAYGGISIGAHRSVPDVIATGTDLLVVPGAIDIASVLDDPSLVQAVISLARVSDRVASVCTGAFALASAGLLEGRPWTTHWEDVAALSERVSGGRRARVVDAGSVLTAGGISSGIDLALHVVAQSADLELARLTARQIDYRWEPGADAPDSVPTGAASP